MTTASGEVTKVQRMYKGSKIGWGWSRIYGEAKAWMLLPESYKEN